MHSPRYIALLVFTLVLCPESPAQNSVTAEAETARVVGKEVSISGRSGSDSSGNAQYAGPAASADHADGEPNWVRAWLRRVDAARASQPHFTAPIVTTHVMLVQQYRYDMSWQQDPTGGITANYGAGRGLEIIPTTRLEVGVSPPNYLVHQSSTPDGMGDFAWQVKFRAFSATEGKGDYFVGFFMGGTAPTGNPPNGTGHVTWSPTFAAAKGVGPWDIQSTLGASLPGSGTSTLGRTVIFNTEINYRFRHIVWPMLEQNSAFWYRGIHDGEKQVFLTPGIVFGSFPLTGRLRVAVGGGVQTAVTRYHQYNHRWILSVRFPF